MDNKNNEGTAREEQLEVVVEERETTARKELLQEAAEELRKSRWESIDSLDYEDESGSIKISKKDLKKLNIKNGDVVIVRRFQGLTTYAIDWLANELGERGFGNCIVVVVDRLSDVKSLDERIMAKYGWVRSGNAQK